MCGFAGVESALWSLLLSLAICVATVSVFTAHPLLLLPVLVTILGRGKSCFLAWLCCDLLMQLWVCALQQEWSAWLLPLCTGWDGRWELWRRFPSQSSSDLRWITVCTWWRDICWRGASLPLQLLMIWYARLSWSFWPCFYIKHDTDFFFHSPFPCRILLLWQGKGELCRQWTMWALP